MRSRGEHPGNEAMTPLTVRNVTKTPVIVPARGGLAVVLRPGEAGTVCPETLRGEGALTDLLARGLVSTVAVHQVPPGNWRDHDDFDSAA